MLFRSLDGQSVYRLIAEMTGHHLGPLPPGEEGEGEGDDEGTPAVADARAATAQSLTPEEVAAKVASAKRRSSTAAQPVPGAES